MRDTGRLGIVLLAASVAISATGCQVQVRPPEQLLDLIADREHHASAAGVLRGVTAAMDAAAAPCEDFYQYACGRWVAPPVGKPNFDQLAQYAHLHLWKLLDELYNSDVNQADTLPMREFYASCIDVDTLRARRLAPLEGFLRPIDTVESPDSLMAALGIVHRHGIPMLFTPLVVPDAQEPTRYTLELQAGSLGLPSAQMYLSDSPITTAIGHEYRRVVNAALFELGRDENPDESAAAFLDLETDLARQTVPPHQLWSEAGRNAFTVAEFAKLTGLPWQAYVDALGVRDLRTLRAGPSEYFRVLGKHLNDMKPPILRSYLQWRTFQATRYLVHHRAPDFFFQLWFRCVDTTQTAFGDLLWARYAEQHSGAEKRQYAEQIWHAIQEAFLSEIRGATTLGPNREPLERKVSAATAVLGFAASPSAAPNITSSREQYFENVMRSRQAWLDLAFGLIGQPVDPTRPAMRPAGIIIPHYVAAFNRIVLPFWAVDALVVQPEIHPALTFGSLGVILAHELAHSIDRTGRQFDAAGGLVLDDGQPDVLAELNRCLGRHYGRFEASPSFYSRLTASTLPSLPVDTDLTLDENFADVIGIRTALAAYRQQVARVAQDPPPVPDLSNDQLFFVVFAQNWCGEPEHHAGRFLAEYDQHTPSRARVNAALSALPEFAQVFHCGEGSRMSPHERCVLP